MTLGGLALAVGILVYDATVEIENTHRSMGMKKPLVKAVLDGVQQVAVPAFVSTLAICIVFVPVLLLTVAAKFLFTPLAEAVVYAMLASYLLSRTLIPNMVHYLLKKEVDLYREGEGGEPAEAPGWNWKILGGLSAGDMVIVNPNDNVREGVKVRATATKANLDVDTGTPAQRKQSSNAEKLQPEPNGEKIPKKPSQTDRKRGPGF
jgi:hypothetical protein